jgi:hypothetical protein
VAITRKTSTAIRNIATVRRTDTKATTITPPMRTNMTTTTRSMSQPPQKGKITVSEKNRPKMKEVTTPPTSTLHHIAGITAARPPPRVTAIRTLVHTRRPTQVHQWKNGFRSWWAHSTITPMAFATTFTTIPSYTLFGCAMDSITIVNTTKCHSKQDEHDHQISNLSICIKEGVEGCSD